MTDGSALCPLASCVLEGWAVLKPILQSLGTLKKKHGHMKTMVIQGTHEVPKTEIMARLF